MRNGAGRFAHDGAFWRRLAWVGAAHGPLWWVRYSPAAFGLAGALLVPEARHAVHRNLVRIRGPVSPLRDALDVGRTFAAYAGCLAESLANGSKNGRVPDLYIYGERNLLAAMAEKRGIITPTAHTGGWELVGPGLSRDHGLDVMMAMERERNEDARRLHDDARRAGGLEVAHVGADPFASLRLLRHLRAGGLVGIQIDRMPEGMRGRAVRLLDTPARLPEGPLRLAQVSGSPLLPAFCARLGFRRVLVDIAAPIHVPRRATEADLDAAAQAIADALSRFLRAHPTQWFHFGS